MYLLFFSFQNPSSTGIKKDSRYDRQLKKFLEKRRSKRATQAVQISIEGRKMAL
jgi:hypothetical protein